MGTGIHSYIETVHKAEGKDKPYVSCFGQVSIGRDYTLFTIMAGVRGDPSQALFLPKGLPDNPRNMSFQVMEDYTLFVSDKKDADGEGCSCSRERAEQWVKNGSSEWADEGKQWVTHPDWHSASWLSLEELEAVQAAYVNVMRRYTYKEYFEMQEKIKEQPQWKDLYEKIIRDLRIAPHHRLSGVIGAMRGLRNEQTEPRLVFWFDN